MENNNTVVIYLHEENGDGRAPIHNIINYLQGLHRLIDLYTTANGFPNQDGITDRIHILPPPGSNDPTIRFYVEFVLMGPITNARTGNDIRTIRVPLSNDLYIRSVEIVNNDPNIPPRSVALPEIDYATQYNDVLSVLTTHLYDGLNRLEENANNNNQNGIKYALFNIVLMIAEAARNEVVRTAVLDRNRFYFENSDNREFPKMTGEQYTYFRKLFDWTKRFEASSEQLEEIDKEPREKIFGDNKRLSSSLNRIRYLKKTRKMKMTKNEGCKEYCKFHDSNFKDDDDFDENGPPNFEQIEQKTNDFVTKNCNKYGSNNTGGDKYTTTAPAGGNKRSIDVEIDQLQEKIDEDQRTLEVMIGKKEETDEYKNRIKEKYSIDLNDDDTKEVAKSYREEVEQSFLDQATKFLGESMKTNTIIRNITIYGSKRVVLLINKLWPRVIEIIAKKVGPKAAGSLVAKKIPLISVGVGLGLGIGRFIKGDWKGGVCEITSGVVSTVPGGGTIVSGGIDVFLAGRDYVILQEKTQGLVTLYANSVVDLSTVIQTNKSKLLSLIVQSQAEDIREFEYVPLRHK